MATMLRVRDVMSTPAIQIEPEASMRQVALLLEENHVGALVVVGAEGLEGIVSERDVVHILATDADLDDVWAADVMSTEPAWVTAEDTMDDAAAAMADNWARHLPVLDEDGTVRGVVSARDVLRVLGEMDELDQRGADGLAADGG